MDPFSGVSGVSHLFFADDFILFAEAMLDQVAVVQPSLQDHKDKVNVIKSNLFLQCNVKPQLARERRRLSGITSDLGLGVPLLHQRVSKATYQVDQQGFK